MNAETLTLELIGTRPLLMRSGRLADPLDPIATELSKVTAKRPKTQADHGEIGRLEFLGGLWLDGGRPCVPAEVIEAAFLAAARTRRRGRQAQAGFLVERPSALIYDGPSSPDELWAQQRFRFRHGVRVNDSRTIRTRPIFDQWRARVEVTFLPSVLDPREVRDLFAVAGFGIGIGDWRPKFGRFSVS
jgi:hypothetical protein